MINLIVAVPPRLGCAHLPRLPRSHPLSKQPTGWRLAGGAAHPFWCSAFGDIPPVYSRSRDIGIYYVDIIRTLLKTNGNLGRALLMTTAG